MAVDGYAVNGAALVYVGTGTLGALQLLGFTDQGVDVEIMENKAEIFTDIFGPMTPHDFQDMGMVARIVCPLIAMDRTVMNTVLGRSNQTTKGQVGTPGLVLGVNGYAFRVGISSLFDVPWSFSYAVTRPRHGTRLATKANPYRIEFFAWPYASYTVVTGKDAPLWTRSLA